MRRDGLTETEQDLLSGVCFLATMMWDEQEGLDPLLLERLQRKGLVEMRDNLWQTTERGTQMVSNWMNDDI